MSNVTPGYVFTGPTDSLTSSKLNLLGTPTVSIGTSEIITAMIADNSVTMAKLAAASTTGVLLGTTTPTGTVLGEIVINNTGDNPGGLTNGLAIGNTTAACFLSLGQNTTTAYCFQQWIYNATPTSGYYRMASSTSLKLFAGNHGTDIITLAGAGVSSAAGLTVDYNNNTVIGSAASATNSTVGFFYLNTCAGTPTGVPATTYTGRVPMIFDTTGVKLWIYTGGAWKGVVVA